MKILGIETSCDETGIALYDDIYGLQCHIVHSQIKSHMNYGGIVPEIASRKHIKYTILLIKKILKKNKLKINDINGIAYTAGPGLIGSLIVGATIGRSLSYALNIPSVPINHMEGHLLSPMIKNNLLKFPFLSLLVSGKHTEIIKAISFGNYKILGKSLDDAAGEASDKIAKLLGIKYPGGKYISFLAKNGKKNNYKFPRPMINKPGLNFSFSGLKTFASNIIKKNIINKQIKSDIAMAFEDALIDTLLIKCNRALDFTGLKNLVIAGGVSANSILRKRFSKNMKKRKVKLFYPKKEFCTDNAAMIAYVGLMKLKNNLNNKDLIIKVNKKWSLEEEF
ncbi:tRNA (adenosine(37)-N6)-threonylcarbamoyltransferase complex transferase subunit TsaD [Sodalis-like secondary symbiont of Drepanosiphum platanoidis]|uniref:tRNA (adenosine(37)-N6)-threonylcarbamoyltransferase complex transferase subunit TsaD n=1 Tax=Sodalis-like secondary symbiont of Drepanosiphum platanoidis TaxID=2994493 RepID=UPI0034645C94